METEKQKIISLLDNVHVYKIITDSYVDDSDDCIASIEDNKLVEKINSNIKGLNFYKNHYVMFSHNFFIGINDNKITIGKLARGFGNYEKIDCDINIKL